MEIVITMLLIMQLELLVLAGILLRKRRQSRRFDTACFIDTSALIDGRIVDAARAGFMPEHIVIPRSVLSELQLLADGSDSEKRSRARHGLDIARALQDLDSVNVTIIEDQQTAHNVDDQLLLLARKYNGSVCTIDYNLNKVAKAESIRVLNINELAKNLRMNFLPGERVSIMVTQKGSDSHQGVGYMADGTMVVIEQAKPDIGKVVNIEFIRSIQTDAGRMLFAKKVVGKDESTRPQAVKKTKKRTSSAGRSPRKAEDALVELANG